MKKAAYCIHTKESNPSILCLIQCIQATELIFFLLVKNNILINKKTRKQPQSILEVYEREANGVQEKGSKKETKHFTSSPTPQSSEKIYQRICIINTIHLCPRPQGAQERSFHPMNRRGFILKIRYVPFPS